MGGYLYFDGRASPSRIMQLVNYKITGITYNLFLVEILNIIINF